MDGTHARAALLDDDTSAYRMHVQREFPISSAASDLWVCWAGRAHAVGSTAIETVIETVAASHRAARRQQRSSHEVTRTVGPAVAVSLLAATVAALAWLDRPDRERASGRLSSHEATNAPAAQPRTWMITRLCRDKKVDRNSDDQ